MYSSLCSLSLRMTRAHALFLYTSFKTWNCYGIYFKHTANNYPLSIYAFPKNILPSITSISTKYFQKRIIMFSLALCILYNTRCSHSVVMSASGTPYFQTELWNFSSTEDSYFQIRSKKMVLNLLYSLLKYILGFVIEVWLIPFVSCNPNLN